MENLTSINVLSGSEMTIIAYRGTDLKLAQDLEAAYQSLVLEDGRANPDAAITLGASDIMFTVWGASLVLEGFDYEEDEYGYQNAEPEFEEKPENIWIVEVTGFTK